MHYNNSDVIMNLMMLYCCTAVLPEGNISKSETLKLKIMLQFVKKHTMCTANSHIIKLNYRYRVLCIANQDMDIIVDY